MTNGFFFDRYNPMARLFLYVHPNSGDIIVFDGQSVVIDHVMSARWNSHLGAVEMQFIVKLPNFDGKENLVSVLQSIASSKKEIYLKDFTSENIFPLKLKSVDVSKKSIYKVGLHCLFESQNYDISYKTKNEEKQLSLPSIKSSSSIASSVIKSKSDTSSRADFIELD